MQKQTADRIATALQNSQQTAQVITQNTITVLRDIERQESEYAGMLPAGNVVFRDVEPWRRASLAECTNRLTAVRSCHFASFNRDSEDIPESRRAGIARNVRRGARVRRTTRAPLRVAVKRLGENYDEWCHRALQHYAPGRM